jgi:hypothetical protein
MLGIFLVPGRFGFVNRRIIGYCLAPGLKKQLFDRISRLKINRS